MLGSTTFSEPTKNVCQSEVSKEQVQAPKSISKTSALPIMGSLTTTNDTVESLRRERNMLQCELSTLQRTHELQKNLHLAKDMLNEFNGIDGSFQRWASQLALLRSTYQLDEKAVKTLISIKLKGKALDWWFSKPEHVFISVDQLLNEMELLYNHPQSKKQLRKEFEARVWERNETFREYFHSKINLAYNVRIDEDEVIEHIIDGIPSCHLQDYARLQNFQSKSAVLAAFKHISICAHDRQECPQHCLISGQNVRQEQCPDDGSKDAENQHSEGSNKV